MKKLIACLLALALASCNSPKGEGLMIGAYKMLSQSIKRSGIEQPLPGQTQMKIYTSDHMMYTNLNLSDSVASFGVATYEMTKSGVSEHIIYSASDSTATTVPQTFDLAIERTPAGFRQLIKNANSPEAQPFDMMEEYERVSKDTTSPLDGAWEGILTYEIRGNDTTMVDIIQYKAYQSGYFMFAHTYVDTGNRLHTGMGFGTFEMTGENSTRETILASNVGTTNQEFSIKIEFRGPNEYTQTWAAADGTQNMEVYRRMKKD
ncbi:MAG: hypothetical protein JST46_05185 [Bacteroidetes bacterium]|nr:hypothetical protein [Bacteroidota bacterium]